MANEMKVKGSRINKQSKLPPIAQSEAIASLAWVVMYRAGRINGNDEKLVVHTDNIMEWGHLHGVFSDDDMMPF